jgi:hypothetical protein
MFFKQVPVPSVRKGDLVLLQGRPCRVTEITTTKMMHASSGRVQEWFACDDCTDRIVGTRYHCLDCDDFDLCEDCEPANRHAGGKHVFAKHRE